MTFEEIINQASEMLQRRGQVSCRTLKRQFELDDDALEDLKFELIQVKKLASEDESSILTWIGEAYKEKAKVEPVARPQENFQPERESQDIAERRQLTVMFIDLVGSTVLSQKLDPEDFREVLYEYQELFDSIITKYQGQVVQHQGDGIVAYFGFPIAQEDDPRRAIMSGLDMLASMDELNLRLQKKKNVTIQVRIGLHTGMVVVGTAGGRGHSLMHAIGEGPNLASRIQNEALPNTLVISEVTRKLVSSYFETKHMGAFNLKGFTEPMDLYLVLKEKEKDLIDLMSAVNLTPMIGREWERAKIIERWDLARESNGQFVLISGEAGIGKTRLVYSVASEITKETKPPRTFRCLSYHCNASFQPIIEKIQHEIGLDQEDKPRAKLEKLELYLKARGYDNPVDIALFAGLLFIPLLGKYDELNMPAERKKNMTTSTLMRWMLDGNDPSMILFEDIHWADPSTLELLGLVLDNISSSSILLIATARPEFQPGWKKGSHIIQVVVNRLTRNQSEAMIRELAKDLPAFVLHDLLTKTDGNPLFVEEVTKWVLESGVLEQTKDGYQLKASLKSVSIPNTLQDSLMARLDRLGPAKEVAQICATIGREFSYSLVKAISQLGDDVLSEDLSKLISAELLVGRGEIPNAFYTFKHALVQETAYMSLLKKRRQEFHRRIVEALEKSLTEVVQSNPELLAYHCTEAGMIDQAIPYWKQAGELALSRSAHAEAINHLNEGLLLLNQVPDSSQKIQNEILFQIALGVPLTALRGYGAPEVEHAYARASELCRQVGDKSQLVPALYGLWRFYLLRAVYKEALTLSEKILSLAESSSDPLNLVVAHRAAGSTNFYLGNLDSAWLHLKEVISSNTAPQQRTGTLLYDVVDAWVTSRSYASWTLWLQGYTDQAMTQCMLAIEAAYQMNHPFSKALTNSFASWLYQFNGDSGQAKLFAQQGLTIAEENGFAFWVGWGRVLECWANDVEGNGVQLGAMQDGLDIWYATGSKLGSSYFLFLMGERCLAHNDLMGAWQNLNRAKEFIDKSGEHFWHAEIYRLEGMLHLASGQPETEKAEYCFRTALAIAASQKAKSLELRAAISLAKLLADTPRKAEAQHALQEIVSWFQEGRDLPVMEEARALLNAL
ncbi:MAG TPA: adenylate/guanylate cyclase domain-containing protein [Chitinophagaceae bacterium]|nr:adenylate/guanylate cyclase domain-containing protein [Chitinophagaceae bacterium]